MPDEGQLSVPEIGATRVKASAEVLRPVVSWKCHASVSLPLRQRKAGV